MTGIYTREEIEKILKDPYLFCKAIGDIIEQYPSLKPTDIGKLMDIYRTRLKEAFGIED